LLLEKSSFIVSENKVAQADLVNAINTEGFEVLLVRSATKVTAEIIAACNGLKLIGRAGVGLDNIDLNAANAAGIRVFNTPAASSQSVAELVFAHLFSGVRFLHDSNYKMRTEEDGLFNKLKKAYSSGRELQGCTLGIIGIGRIGQAVAKMAIGMGMKVRVYDPYITEVDLNISIFQTNETISVKVVSESLESVLQHADFITLHVPGKIDGKALIGVSEISIMKQGVGIVNAARGGVVDEDALLEGIESGKVFFAGLDVFENEPNPRKDILQNASISLSPHIGASTSEAQERIGIELAESIISFFG